MQNYMSSSQFKVHCLKLIEQVAVEKKKIIITKRGKPLAQLSALENIKDNELMFGSLKDKASIEGDIISSLDEEWEVEK